MKRNILQVILLLCLSLSTAFSQSITGSVEDQRGEPLIGVTILLKGNTNLGTVTDIDGRFSMEIPSLDEVLIFSYVGYETQEFVVNGQTVLTITMSESASQLEEVVITGYGTQIRKNVSSSISKVDGAELNAVPVSSFEAALQGRAAGVQVTPSSGIAGAAVRIRIRGTNSATANSEPLYIVDGIVMESGGISSSGVHNALNLAHNTNALAAINPSDIASIEILKDAAATAIYGARGANGVVLITTKRGAIGKTQISVDIQTGISNATHKVDYLNAEEYLFLAQEAWYNSGNDPRDFWKGSGVLQDGLTKEQALRTNTNWTDQVLRQGHSQNLNISVSGGNEKTRFFMSGSVKDEQSIFVENDYTKISTRLNLDHNLTERIKLGTNIMYTRVDDKTVPINWAGGIGLVPTNLPIWPVYKDDGTFFNPTQNALANIKSRDILFKNNTLIANWFLTAEIIDGLVFRSEFGMNSLNNFDSQYEEASTDVNGRAYAASTIGSRFQWNFKNILNYKKDIGRHNFDLMVGAESQKYTREVNNIVGDGFVNSTLRTPQDAANIVSSFIQNEFSFLSYLGRINYNYDGKYLLSLTARRDGSSRFGQNNRWGFFPAISAGYTISEEPFFESYKRTINQLKLRASYGQSGNAEIGNYSQYSLYSQGNYNGQGGFNLSNIGDDQLGWETSNQLDLGISFELFNGKIRGEFDYYDKKTEDLLLPFPVSRLTGVSAVTTNLGEIRNKGIEIMLSTTNVQTTDFLWETTLTLAHNENEVTSLGPDVEGGLTSAQGLGSITIIEGHPIGISRGAEWLGVDPGTGEDIYMDDEAGPLTLSQILAQYGNFGTFRNENPHFYGNPWPNYTGGIANNFSYKNFTLDVFFTFSQGATFENGYLISSAAAFDEAAINPSRDILNRWRNPGDVTHISQVNKDPTIFGSSTEFSYEIDYIRMKDLTFGYTFNPKTDLIQNIRAYVKLTNYLTFTNAPNSVWDPEFVGSNPTNTNQSGFWRTSPQAKTITVGLKADF